MTQPPGPPPQGGFGPPSPNGPQPGQPDQPWQPPAGPPGPPGPPPEGGYGYPQAPGQAPQMPGPPPAAPYGQPPYGALGGFPPPPGGPGGGTGSGGKIAAIIAGAVALLALLGGGVYLAVDSGDGGHDSVVAGPSTSALPTEGTDTGGGSGGTLPTGDPTGDPPADTGGSGKTAPSGDDFRGQWLRGDKVLTIADKFTVGPHAGKFNLNWIEDAGGKLCMGYGAMQGHDLHLIVSCSGQNVTATVHKIAADQGVEVSWDDGTTDDLDYYGAIS
jgi:hypothetical protein